MVHLTHNFNTPLRYPGGKGRVSGFIEDIILLNNLEGCKLYEMYAGGAGASINILFSGICKKIVLNDLDYHIYAFWFSILNHTDEFLKLLVETEVTVENWRLFKRIYECYTNHNILEVGFSTFFLNRANRSGILYRAGPIGGISQNGKYKINARFNKPDLIKRILRIADKQSQIELYNRECKDLLSDIFLKEDQKRLLFLDPPYYVQGENLYMNFYNHADHIELRDILEQHRVENWLLTYDNCGQISKLYTGFRKSLLPMTYTLQTKRKSKEIAIFSDNIALPKNLRLGNKSIPFQLIGTK